jgi:predicted dehydrogenase/threonine dehydrogenase-like Zn-dependent dehydrogenase
MKQVCLISGAIAVVDVPAPACEPGGVVVRTSHSLISTGTEIATTGGGGRESLIRRAITNPQLVRKVWEKIGTVGVSQTIDLVRARTTSSLSLGYSAAGQVVEVGAEVADLRIGDRVACAGAGYANHAEMNFVPRNLVARIPDGVSYPDAAFTTLGAIALQGVHRLAPTAGEQIVVLGLGLIGQLASQLLRYAGCRVLGIDVLGGRVDLAVRLGIEQGMCAGDRDAAATVAEWTGQTGADGVVVCATGGDIGLLNRAFDLCRPKGRVVLVGDVPIRIAREKIYKKELDFFISCSYGPGRYDAAYEERGRDYPLPYVRWTEGRNFGEVLRLIAGGALRVRELAGRAFPVEAAAEAYQYLRSVERPIAALLDYELVAPSVPPVRSIQVSATGQVRPGTVTLGVIGTGTFFRGVHLPNLTKHGGFAIKTAMSRSGVGLRDLAGKHGIQNIATDAQSVFDDPEIDAVLISTRHHLHADYAVRALRAGKHVLVEKPMGLTVNECGQVLSVVRSTGMLLAVGFNRRFSPHALRAKSLLADIREPKTIVYRVNAGPLPSDHWLRDPKEGGGRLVGEAVHFFDFLRWLVDSTPVRVNAAAIDRGAAQGIDADNAAVTLAFADGSVGVVVYNSQGDATLGKERVEIFAGGRNIVIDDFAALQIYGVDGKSDRTRSPDKGHFGIVRNFYDAITGATSLGVTGVDGYWATWCAEEALRSVRGDAPAPLTGEP